MERPLGSEEAVAVVDDWLAVESVRIVIPGPRHWAIFRELMVTAQVTGPLVTDARLGAVALEDGATLATHDLDFLRFENLKTLYPLKI